MCGGGLLKELLEQLYLWVDDYIQSFYTDNKYIQPMIALKEEHTKCVVTHCRELAENLRMSNHDCVLAEIIGLLHDIGRFKQYSIYQTFNDRLSENHAALGLAEIADLALLRQLTDDDREVIHFAIINHNAKKIARVTDERKVLFAKLIRDADKLDIYRVLSPRLKPSDGTGVNADFIQLFLSGRQCDYTLIKTSDDQKLVRLLWLYDIYFPWTMRKIIACGYFEEIVKFLPEDEQIKQGVALLDSYIQKFAARN